MNKLLFAINHKKTESEIEQKISDKYLVVGAATYREAVLDKLGSSGADTLLLRETLNGSISIENLLKHIRIDYPNVRIIIICQERQKQDPFLRELASMGIYDIINADRITIDTIVSYILTPRTFRDVIQFGIGLDDLRGQAKGEAPSVQDSPVEEKKKSGGHFLSSLKGAMKGIVSPKTPTPMLDTDSKEEYPQVNLELVKETMRDTEARKAQTNLDYMIEEAIKQRTSEYVSKIAALEKSLAETQSLADMSSSGLTKTTQQLDAIKAERDALQLKLDEMAKSTKEGYSLYEERIRELLAKSDTPTWYQDQVNNWTAQLNELQEKLDSRDSQIHKLEDSAKQLQNENESLSKRNRTLEDQMSRQTSVRVVHSSEQDKQKEAELLNRIKYLENKLSMSGNSEHNFSDPIEPVPTLPDNIAYQASKGLVKTILVVGAKHGIGTTTISLNIATELASKGNRVMLIEFNKKYPMLNQFFEFTHVGYGIEEMLRDMSNGDYSGIDKATICPHYATSQQRQLTQTYKKLPAGLNLMLFSNDSLAKEDAPNSPQVAEATVYSLFHNLSSIQQYSYIIIDVQCDDFGFIREIINSGYPIDKLCIVSSQDPHSVMSAGTLISKLSGINASNLLINCVCVLTRYNKNSSITNTKIRKGLHLTESQMFALSEDSTGYLESTCTALPYVLSGRFKGEYSHLVTQYFS